MRDLPTEVQDLEVEFEEELEEHPFIADDQGQLMQDLYKRLLLSFDGNREAQVSVGDKIGTFTIPRPEQLVDFANLRATGHVIKETRNKVFRVHIELAAKEEGVPPLEIEMFLVGNVSL